MTIVQFLPSLQFDLDSIGLDGFLSAMTNLDSSRNIPRLGYSYKVFAESSIKRDASIDLDSISEAGRPATTTYGDFVKKAQGLGASVLELGKVPSGDIDPNGVIAGALGSALAKFPDQFFNRIRYYKRMKTNHPIPDQAYALETLKRFGKDLDVCAKVTDDQLNQIIQEARKRLIQKSIEAGLPPPPDFSWETETPATAAH